MKKFNLILCSGLVLILFGCAGANKAEFTTSNAKTAVAEVTQLMLRAEDEQADLLTEKEFNNGVKYLERARQGLANGNNKEIIMDNAAIAKAYFQEARLKSGVKSLNATRMLSARKAALKAGVRDIEKLQAAILDVDDDLRGDTDDFEDALKPKEVSEFQKRYFSLEIKAVQFRKLNGVIRAVLKANSKQANKLAPKSLRMAILDLNEAENLVAQSPRNPRIHEASVKKAVASSILLLDVMDVIDTAPGTPEKIALKIVNQNRELGILSKNVGLLEKNLKSTQSNLQTTQSSLMETESALETQKQELEKSSTQVRFQNAMDEARVQFSEDEALVYQQGSKLIFRLKRINFASGTATVPAASKPLLQKVDNIIRKLEAEIVAVQGHTDSVGAGDLNLKLSTKRAISVANYLASLAGGYKIGYIGYGETRPIASNETKVGRAINRRVDLVVTAKK